MRAQLLTAAAPVATRPLDTRRAFVAATREPGEVRVRVHVCGCCRTDLHVVEGDLELPRLPIVPGHQVVGVVDALGAGCSRLGIGDRVGVAWLHRTCGVCEFCARDEENLCVAAEFTGWSVDGGYADELTVPEAFAVQLPDGLGDLEAAPLAVRGGHRLPRAASRRGRAR